MRVSTSLVILTLFTCSQATLAQEELRNWFNDPFLRLTAQDSTCPVPAGPFVTEKERLAQSHRRAEKGTTAWLAGEAERPKAYAYDVDIAAALAERVGSSKRPSGSSVWATVQGRVVYLEGCVANESEARELEELVRGTPFVQQVITIVRTNGSVRVPYRVMPPASARVQ